MAKSHTRKNVGQNLYQRGDGVFMAGLTINGKWTMKTLSARTKTEAKQQLAKLKVEADSPRQERTPILVFATVADDFIRYYEAKVASGECSPRTLEAHRWVLRDYIRPAWDGKPMKEFTPDVVVRLTAELRAAGKTPSVLRAIEDTESRLFNFAVRREMMSNNPVAKLERGERVQVAKNRNRRVLDHNEITRLLNAAHDLFTRAMLGVLLFTGVRQGELLGLRWMDIDFDAGLVHVRKQLQRPASGQPVKLARLKMDSVRDVVLVPQLAALLKEHKLGTRHSSPEDYVFSAGDGSPLHYSRANRSLAKASEKAQVERPSSHVFRRTFASHLIIDLGLDVVRVQRQLGHSLPSVTFDRYSYLFEQARHANELRDGIANSSYGALLS